jgi:hypothetical protein
MHGWIEGLRLINQFLPTHANSSNGGAQQPAPSSNDDESVALRAWEGVKDRLMSEYMKSGASDADALRGIQILAQVCIVGCVLYWSMLPSSYSPTATYIITNHIHPSIHQHHQQKQPHQQQQQQQTQKKAQVLRSFRDGLGSTNTGFSDPAADGYQNLAATYLQLVRLGAFDG